MQSLSDSTLAAFMKSDITSKNLDIPSSSSSSKAAVEKRSNRCTSKKNDSDIAKYFNDSLVFLSTDNNREKENNPPTNVELEIIPESPKNIGVTNKKKSGSEQYFISITSPKCSIITKNRRPNKGKSSTRRKKYTQLSVQLGTTKEENIVSSDSLDKIQVSNNHGIQLNTEVSRNCSSETSVPSREISTSNLEQKCSNQTTNSSIEVPVRVSTPDRCKLSSWGLPLTILRKYEARGVSSMFPWQVECLSNRDLLEKNQNLVYSAPTSAGKTLVAEILVIKTVIERRKKVIFILPFVSVVREKMYYFQDLLSDSGVRVEGFMGGCAPPGGFAATDVAIATIEKANSLLNQLMEEGNLVNLGAVVIDELHLLGDPYRGYLLELLLTKLKYMTLREELVHVQLIGMSATLPNLALLAKWLNAELYKTDFRPVPLNEFCKIGSTIYDNKMNNVRSLPIIQGLSGDSDNILQLCIETICDGHSVLIFCPTKNWCENLAQQVALTFSKLGREDSPIGRSLREQLSAEAIMETLEQLKRCPIGLDAVLKNTVSFGAAFHHAGLTMDERDVVEGAFRAGALRVLTATSTLSSGVNLPARRVIIRSLMAYGKPLDTLTYRQMIGRAGRMGKDTAGESILVCKANETKAASILLCAQLQPIESCLEGSEPLIRALLEAVASEVAYTAKDIDLYIKCTLVSLTSHDLIEESTKEAIKYLVDNELFMLQKTNNGDERWVATPLGKACLAASIPPSDGLFLFEELQKARRCFVLDTELHVIYLVTPLNSSNQIGQIDWIVYLDLWKSISESERRVGQLVGVEESFLIAAIRGIVRPGKGLDVHKRFYTALALHELVREVSLSEVCHKYGCNRGVIQGLQQSAATFAGMVTQFCKKLGWSCMELLIGQFQARLQFGVCRELLDLLRLPMLNGLRARSLYKEGITCVAELAVANELDVERALHKALPFESGKEHEGEHEVEAAKRNKMRSVFVTGRDGLTPREAAVILVREARTLVQNELGLDELQWNQREHSTKSTDRTTSSSELSSRILEQSSSTTNLLGKTTEEVATIDYKNQGNSKEPEDLQGMEEKLSTRANEAKNSNEDIESIQPISETIEASRAISKTEEPNQFVPKTIVTSQQISKALESSPTCTGDRKIDSQAAEVIRDEEIFDFTDQTEIELEKKIENISKSRTESPAVLLIRESLTKSSESRSPSLFGDSLNLDTQECNMLEQNVIDSLNISAFGDTVFSGAIESQKNTPERRSSATARPNLRSSSNSQQKTSAKKFAPRQSPGITELKNKSKSIAWDDDSWNNTNGVIEKVNEMYNANSRANIDNTLANIPRKDPNLDRNEKRISTTPVLKNDYENILTPKTRLTELRKIPQKRKLSEPDLEKSPIASILTFSATRKMSVDSNKSDTDDVIIPSQILNPLTCGAKNRTRLKLESLRRSRTQQGTTPTIPGGIETQKNPETFKELRSNTYNIDSCSVVSNSDDEAPTKRPNALIKSSAARPATKAPLQRKKALGAVKTATESSRNKKAQPIKINEPQVTNLTSNLAAFNLFKREVVDKKDISLALGCESFLKNTATIGTKIIGVTGADGRKKSKKVDNCVHGNKKLCGVAISWDGVIVHYISFNNNQDSEVPVKERLDLLTEILNNENITIRCFAFKETYKILYNCCSIAPSCNFLDPKTADWLLDPDHSERNFNALINEHLTEAKLLLQRTGTNIGDVGPGLNVQSAVHSESRATTEAALTWHVMNTLITKLRKRSPTLLETFREVEMGTATLLARMELNGIGINLKSLQELSDVIQQEMSQLEKKAYSLAGKKFNFSSSKSVAQVLGLYKGKKVSTNKAALEHCDNPISSLVTSWRKLSATQIKIVFPLLRLAECSSRIFGNCLTNTTTGRVSMHEPNLQNVPRDFNSQDGSFVISVRMVFAPILGNVILSADYCQLELRILAHFSKEPNLCKILRKEGDVFKNIAARWYNVAEEKIDDGMRQRTKQLCYGMIYGMGVKTLSETLSVTETEAKEFLETFMSAYPGIRPWLTKIVDEARVDGYVKTLLHRRRYFPALDSQIPSERGQAERQAVNTKVQGSAADIAKKAMVVIDERMRREFPDTPLVLADAPIKRKLRSHSRDPLPRGGFLVLQIHDELLYEVNAADLQQVGKIIQESMEHSFSLRVPLPVKLKVGPTWGDLTEYKCQS